MKKEVAPVTMEQAAYMAGFRLEVGKTTTKADCPFCGGKKKLYITLSSSRYPDGIAHCMKCGENISPIGMYGLSIGTRDLKEASRSWYELNRSKDADAKKVQKKLEQVPKAELAISVEENVAPVSVCDHTYRTMLEFLTLLPSHRKNLQDRGLTDIAIDTAAYKSVPVNEKNRELLINALLQRGCILKGVPGFYLDDGGNWKLNVFGTGILIPQRNGFGQIQGFQIRMDTSEKGKRYLALSSRDKPSGAPAQTFCHLRHGEKGLGEIILTEGALKADVISCLTGYSVLSVPGVNSLAFLPEALYDLKNTGLRKVCIAYDMDIRTNVAVQKAENKLTRLLDRAGIQYSILSWDERFKGLDDWLASRK